MAYDEGVAQRLREALVEQPGVSEKKMFGGIAFLLRGNRPMRGIVYVSPAGFESDEGLARWLARGTGFAGSLPAK
jgi:hypothetical protein